MNVHDRKGCGVCRGVLGEGHYLFFLKKDYFILKKYIYLFVCVCVCLNGHPSLTEKQISDPRKAIHGLWPLSRVTEKQKMVGIYSSMSVPLRDHSSLSTA